MLAQLANRSTLPHINLMIALFIAAPLREFLISFGPLKGANLWLKVKNARNIHIFRRLYLNCKDPHPPHFCHY
jgi:hypothetical protein